MNWQAKVRYLGWGCLAMGWALSAEATSLDKQLTTMQQAAQSSLDTYVYTVDGLDVTAWMDAVPVVIKVPIYDDKRQWQGDSYYYFKQGNLFAVRMPYGTYQFDSKGKMTVWLDETGQSSELPGSAAWSQRQQWLLKRATQLATAFAPSAYARRLHQPNSDVHLQGDERTAYLCLGQLYSLSGAEKLIHEEKALQINDNQLSGPLQARFAAGWRPLRVECRVNGADQVSQLLFHYTGPVEPFNK